VAGGFALGKGALGILRFKEQQAQQAPKRLTDCGLVASLARSMQPRQGVSRR
jgi:hypothetical protein